VHQEICHLHIPAQTLQTEGVGNVGLAQLAALDLQVLRSGGIAYQAPHEGARASQGKRETTTDEARCAGKKDTRRDRPRLPPSRVAQAPPSTLPPSTGSNARTEGNQMTPKDSIGGLSDGGGLSSRPQGCAGRRAFHLALACWRSEHVYCAGAHASFGRGSAVGWRPAHYSASDPSGTCEIKFAA